MNHPAIRYHHLWNPPHTLTSFQRWFSMDISYRIEDAPSRGYSHLERNHNVWCWPPTIFTCEYSVNPIFMVNQFLWLNHHYYWFNPIFHWLNQDVYWSMFFMAQPPFAFKSHFSSSCLIHVCPHVWEWNHPLSSPFWHILARQTWRTTLAPWRRQDAEVKDLEHEIRQRRHSAVLKEEKFRGPGDRLVN